MMCSTARERKCTEAGWVQDTRGVDTGGGVLHIMTVLRPVYPTLKHLQKNKRMEKFQQKNYIKDYPTNIWGNLAFA
jgi:hypothetical protein